MPLFWKQLSTSSRVCLLFIFLWTCGVLFPSFPNVIGCGLDPSWEHALNLAHFQHLTFGRDVVFTYGPLAYLDYPEPFAVNPYALLAWDFLIYAAAVLFLLRLWKKCSSLLTFSAVCLATCFTAAFRYGLGSSERIQMTLLLGFFFLFADRSLDQIGEWIIAGLLTGTSLLIKFNDGLVNFMLFYILLAYAVWRMRSFNYTAVGVAVVPVLTFLVGFRWVGGAFSALPAYFQLSAAIAGGYSEAMTIVGPTWQLVLALIGVFALFFLLLIQRSEGGYRALLPAAILCGATFKHAFVRQEGHAIPFHVELAAVTGFGLLSIQNIRGRRLLGMFVVANLLCGLWIAHLQLPQAVGTILSFLKLQPLQDGLPRYLNMQRSWKELDEAITVALAPRKLPLQMSRQIENGSFADLTWNVDSVVANHLRWNPQPVFQSYSAYEPILDKSNSSHLSRDGADFLSLRFESIDSRNLFLDDASTWPTVVDQYDVVDGDPTEMLLLKRRSTHRYGLPTSTVGPTRANWNEVIHVPSVTRSQLLLLKVNLGRSLWGRVDEFLYRLEPAYMEVAYRSGATAKFRVTRPNLNDGAIINILPRSLVDILPLFGFQAFLQQDSVATIRFTSESPAQLSNSMTLSWSVMNRVAAPQKPLPSLFYPKVNNLVRLWKPKDGIAQVSGLKAELEGHDLALQSTGPDPQVWLRSSRDMSNFKTLIIRAKFSTADQINVFFGQQGNGRGFGGYSSFTGQWTDVYVRTDTNRFWQNEAGAMLRFDPVTNNYANSRTEIAGIWGSTESLPPDKQGEMNVYLALQDLN